MGDLRPICRPHAVVSSVRCCYTSLVKVSSVESCNSSRPMPLSIFSVSFGRLGESRMPVARRRKLNRPRRIVGMRASSNWTDSKSPYDTLELERDANEEKIKVAYRRLAKFYHPDVYNGRGTLDEGETAEARFIKIQAAYELLIDREKRRQYDIDNRVNPMKASEAWMEWLMRKRKAFYQRGDMAVAAWAEQQQREMNIRARRRARSKIDPDEEKRILEKEKKTFEENIHITLRRHALVLKKRDLMRKKTEEDKRKILGKLLAAEGMELENEEVE